MIKGLEFFAGTQQLTRSLLENNIDCKSLDIVQVRNCRKIDFLIDFMDFDYKAYAPDHFDFMFFGFPCNTFSKASGGKHFFKGFCPLTVKAYNSILMLDRMFQMINYFDRAIFYIENPAGGLYNNYYFKSHFQNLAAHTYRLPLGGFGFCTQKMTDIFTNSQILFIYPQITRQNGRYHKQKFNSLSLRERQAYPKPFTEMITVNIKLNFIENNTK